MIIYTTQPTKWDLYAYPPTFELAVQDFHHQLTAAFFVSSDRVPLALLYI